jgi:CelD/BcsL family acetyltransferase involved in cellulose biosynthesis
MEVAEEIATWLTHSHHAASAGMDRWDILELANVDANDEMVQCLVRQLRNHDVDGHVDKVANTWRLELPETTDEYLALLSKSHRKQLRQLRRRVFETGEAVLRTVEHVDQLDTAWRILTDLHQRRLESLGKPGCFRAETYARFHYAAIQALYRAGRLHLSWLEFDGRPVAAEYHLAGDGVMYAYQGGIDPDALQHQPGRLITLATLERAIGAGYQAFDFCRGDEPYKAHWRAKPRTNLTWRMVCNRPSSRLRQLVWITGQNAQRWMKGSLQLALRKTK